ncbi:hypothetical protein [Terribacillus saccharophilus]|uniref:hypothetical protein n=1 Tax=Terribacillus saccharophilus TaxID=361277 RepID=UPI003D292AA3
MKPIDYDKDSQLMTYSQSVHIEEIERNMGFLSIPYDVIEDYKMELLLTSIHSRYSSDLFPFYLEKYREGSLMYEVIYYYPHEDKLVYEFREYGYPEGKLHAIKAKRRLVNREELQTFLSSGFAWTHKRRIGLLLSYEKIREGKFVEYYQDLK